MHSSLNTDIYHVKMKQTLDYVTTLYIVIDRETIHQKSM